MPMGFRSSSFAETPLEKKLRKLREFQKQQKALKK